MVYVMENLNLELLSFAFGCMIMCYAIINPEISFIFHNLSVKVIKLTYRLKIFSNILFLLLVVIGLYLHYNPSKMTEEEMFSNPLYRDYRLDNCLYDGGKACGLEAAIKWCRAQGFKTAVDFNVQNISQIGMQTRRFGDDFICSRGDICAGFTFIQCSK